jgi:hypothetical protein
MVIDIEKWYIEDFSNVSSIDKNLIGKMELFILEEVLHFNVSISREDYREEHLRMYKNIDKRLSKK